MNMPPDSLAGLAAFAFRCGKVVEQFVVHGKTGLLAPPGGINGFVASIARLQSDPVLWSELYSDACNLISIGFLGKATVKKYLILFEQALSDQARILWK
jgi:hypothetical protein